MSNLELSLVLPIHNQADITESIIDSIEKKLKKTNITYEILMVENGSSDNTLSVLKNLEKRNPRLKTFVAPMGYGSAVLNGLKKTKGIWVGYMPSDGQIDLAVLPPLINELKKNHYDVVKIFRTTRESFVRNMRSKLFNMLARTVYGKLPVKDINGSPRFFKRKYLSILDLQYTDSFIDLEFTLKARYLHLKIKEYPMQTLPRAGGKSTVHLGTVFEFIGNILAYKLGSKFDSWKSRRFFQSIVKDKKSDF